MLVGVQFALLAVLLVLPGGDDWPTPWWIELAGWAQIVGGGLVVLLATRHLGSALTPTPEPRPGEQLRTDGLYRFVRHPIYSGVMLAVVGLVARSGSWATLAVGVVTVVFFNAKAAWEEGRLANRHPGYQAYAARVGRFIPRPRL